MTRTLSLVRGTRFLEPPVCYTKYELWLCLLSALSAAHHETTLAHSHDVLAKRAASWMFCLPVLPTVRDVSCCILVCNLTAGARDHTYPLLMPKLRSFNDATVFIPRWDLLSFVGGANQIPAGL
jgi:hypothetical protein